MHDAIIVGALRGNQDATDAFLSAITGAIPLQEFMAADNIARVMAAAAQLEFQA